MMSSFVSYNDYVNIIGSFLKQANTILFNSNVDKFGDYAYMFSKQTIKAKYTCKHLYIISLLVHL